MKKYICLLTLAIAGGALSCNTQTGSGLSSTARRNLEVSHAVTQCFDTKDFSKLGDYIAVDAVDHGDGNGDIKGLGNMKAAFSKSVMGLDNQKSEIVKELADDDYVMSWAHYTATVTADGPEHKAGDKLDMQAMEVIRFKDGKAVEHWTMMQPAELMKMMGGMKPAAPGGPADSTRKN